MASEVPRPSEASTGRPVAAALATLTALTAVLVRLAGERQDPVCPGRVASETTQLAQPLVGSGTGGRRGPVAHPAL